MSYKTASQMAIGLENRIARLEKEASWKKQAKYKIEENKEWWRNQTAQAQGEIKKLAPRLWRMVSRFIVNKWGVRVSEFEGKVSLEVHPLIFKYDTDFILSMAREPRGPIPYLNLPDHGFASKDIASAKRSVSRYANKYDLPVIDMFKRMARGRAYPDDLFMSYRAAPMFFFEFEVQETLEFDPRKAVVYFSLSQDDEDFNESDFIELERYAVGEVKSLLRVDKIENEGHDEFGRLVCSIPVFSRMEVEILFSLIERNTDRDGIIYLPDGFQAEGFIFYPQGVVGSSYPIEGGTNWVESHKA
jgi:hypothetical protein